PEQAGGRLCGERRRQSPGQDPLRDRQLWHAHQCQDMRPHHARQDARAPPPPPVSTEGLGPGFAAYVTSHKITAKDISGGEQHEGGWSWAAFDNGLVLFWSEATGVRDNMAGEVAVRLSQKPAQIVEKPVVPPSVHAALTTLSQLLTPFASAASEVAQ